MKHWYLPRPNDKDKIGKLISRYSEYSKDEIVDLCRSAINTNIVGSHFQALHLIALNHVSKKILGKSPISIENNSIISISEANIADF
ncbi:hypothetical protein [Flagellimonas onchidii]|uniref:hypothetical protein n=1 Tax=Flagellimonas onchidii TaxID=2562684 RepID=UPI0010A5AD73|nr:hypothetical protein [Allomuricauda onchidii]